MTKIFKSYSLTAFLLVLWILFLQPVYARASGKNFALLTAGKALTRHALLDVQPSRSPYASVSPINHLAAGDYNTQHQYPQLGPHTGTFDSFLSTKAVKHTYLELSKWIADYVRGISNKLVKIHFSNTILTTWKEVVVFGKQSFSHIKTNSQLTFRYLRAAREYERHLQNSLDSSKDKNGYAPTVNRSRRADIEAIAAIAELHPNHIPAIAFSLEWSVRNVEVTRLKLDRYLTRAYRSIGPLDASGWVRHAVGRLQKGLFTWATSFYRALSTSILLVVLGALLCFSFLHQKFFNFVMRSMILVVVFYIVWSIQERG